MKEESSQALPLLRIPAKLNKNDEQAIAHNITNNHCANGKENISRLPATRIRRE